MLKQQYLMLICIVLLILIGISVVNYTGFAVNNSDYFGVSVIRSPITKNETTGMTQVSLRIISKQNVLLIKEVFSDDFCVVLNYSLNKGVDIFEFNGDVNAWIIGNRSNLDVVLNYSISVDCNVNESAGMVYTLEGGNQTGTVVPPVVPVVVVNNSGNNSGSVNNSVSVNRNVSSNTGNNAVIPVSMSSSPIVQAKNEVELKKLIKTANDRLAAFTDESGGKSDSFYVYVIIGIILVFIIGFVVLIVVTKPREPDFSNMNIQKFRQELGN